MTSKTQSEKNYPSRAAVSDVSPKQQFGSPANVIPQTEIHRSQRSKPKMGANFVNRVCITGHNDVAQNDEQFYQLSKQKALQHERRMVVFATLQGLDLRQMTADSLSNLHFLEFPRYSIN